MLINIPNIISPDLLKIMQEMGHGDEICIGDGNFPARSMAKTGGTELVRLDGHGVITILDAVLQLMPLDTFVPYPVKLMEHVPGDLTPCPIWDEYFAIIAKYDKRAKDCVEFIERFQFYNLAQKCYVIVATGETAVYANIILKKGVIK